MADEYARYLAKSVLDALTAVRVDQHRRFGGVVYMNPGDVKAIGEYTSDNGSGNRRNVNVKHGEKFTIWGYDAIADDAVPAGDFHLIEDDPIETAPVAPPYRPVVLPPPDVREIDIE